MDNSTSTLSILGTLRTVEFRLGLKGYNVDEVDEYLEKAAVEAEQVQERLRIASERLRQATERIAQLESESPRAPGERTVVAPPPAAGPAQPAAATSAGPAVSEDTLQRTLLLAQKFVEQTKRESEAEAAQVVSRAEERARTILAQAEERARQLTTQAEERLRDEVARLEETRGRLAGDVERMSRHLEDQRTKIRASLAEALRWVDERLEPSPAGAAADRPGEPRNAPAPPARGPTAAGTPSVQRSEPAATTAAAGSSPPSAAPRPQVPSPAPGALERQSPVTVPAHSESERTEAPSRARLGVLNGGLFEAGRGESHGFEENRLGD